MHLSILSEHMQNSVCARARHDMEELERLRGFGYPDVDVDCAIARVRHAISLTSPDALRSICRFLRDAGYQVPIIPGSSFSVWNCCR